MAKASSQWQQLTHVVQVSLAELQLGAQSPFSLQRISVTNGWLVLLPIAVLLFLHWKLFLALLLGVVTMTLVYLLQDWDWQPQWSQLRKRIGETNQRSWVAIGCGGLATLSSYMAIAIWSETNSPWIATGAILQGLGTFATLSLLTWHLLRSETSETPSAFEQFLSDLTHTDPVKRLIAVRQITRMATLTTLDPLQQKTALECLRLLASREREPILRAAIFDGVQALDQTHKLSPGQEPFTPAMSRTQVKSRIRQPISKTNL